MIRIPIVLTTLTFVAFSALYGFAATITYEIDFNAMWSAQSHPGAYPGGAHFSALIGGAHSPAVSFWEPGALASAGIEQMAEIGGTSILRSEVQTAINAGSALAVTNFRSSRLWRWWPQLRTGLSACTGSTFAPGAFGLSRQPSTCTRTTPAPRKAAVLACQIRPRRPHNRSRCSPLH
jgi:hypothetical protein